MSTSPREPRRPHDSFGKIDERILESELSSRFASRTEHFDHRAFSVEILLPHSSEALIDEAEFDRDERLPYWAELWPAARALASALLDDPPPPCRVIELGCGIGLPSLALRHLGLDPLATDYYADALLFARVNAARNGLGPLRTHHVDWREPDLSLGSFDLAVAADVLYEKRNAATLRALLPQCVAPGGAFLFADPGRVHHAEFVAAMVELGWTVESVVQRTEPSPAPHGREITLRLVRLRSPRAGRLL